MQRLHLTSKDKNYFVEFPNNNTGMMQAKAFRKNHLDFKNCRIKEILQLYPNDVPCGDILECK